MAHNRNPQSAPNHKLDRVSLHVLLDLQHGTIKLSNVFGHSSSCLGVIWRHDPAHTMRLEDDPYTINITCLELQSLLEQLERDRPNTQARLDFTMNGGLSGMDPMF